MSDRRPELRRDPISGRWVIISSARGKRPAVAMPRQEEELQEVRERCPFCYGNEQKTPPEVLAYRVNGGHNQAGWSLRVIPNKFPVLGIEGGEIMAILEVAMLGHVPYTVLRDGIFAHPTLAESLNNLFSTLDE